MKRILIGLVIGLVLLEAGRRLDRPADTASAAGLAAYNAGDFARAEARFRQAEPSARTTPRQPPTERRRSIARLASTTPTVAIGARPTTNPPMPPAPPTTGATVPSLRGARRRGRPIRHCWSRRLPATRLAWRWRIRSRPPVRSSTMPGITWSWPSSSSRSLPSSHRQAPTATNPMRTSRHLPRTTPSRPPMPHILLKRTASRRLPMPRRSRTRRSRRTSKPRSASGAAARSARRTPARDRDLLHRTRATAPNRTRGRRTTGKHAARGKVRRRPSIPIQVPGLVSPARAASPTPAKRTASATLRIRAPAPWTRTPGPTRKVQPKARSRAATAAPRISRPARRAMGSLAAARGRRTIRNLRNPAARTAHAPGLPAMRVNKSITRNHLRLPRLTNSSSRERCGPTTGPGRAREVRSRGRAAAARVSSAQLRTLTWLTAAAIPWSERRRGAAPGGAAHPARPRQPPSSGSRKARRSRLGPQAGLVNALY